MYAYGYQTFQRKMLEEEKDEATRERKKLLLEHEAVITELKQQLRLGKEINQKIKDEIHRRAGICMRLKNLN